MEEKFIPLEQIIRNSDDFYAHRDKKEQLETLTEHTQRCQKYFKQLCEKKNAVSMFSDFCDCYGIYTGTDARALLEGMWWNVVTFHDTGKHNPYFQRDAMKIENIQVNKDYVHAGRSHSAISAVLYLDYYEKRICLLKSGEDIERLFVLLWYHAYLISRHHSDLKSLKYFWDKMVQGDGRKIVEIFRKDNTVYQETFQLMKMEIGTSDKNAYQNISKKTKKIERCIEKQLNSQTQKQSIFLYCYGKMLYSLLVAADYYAAAEFMSGTEITDFGELSDMEAFRSVYQNTKISQSIWTYEKHVFPMEQRQLEETREMNVLRNEIFLEAQQNLIRGKKKHIFYLEAPTGSGKSNIAMNLSFRLMEQDKQLKKIYYVYPFNTLVEQNLESLENVFGKNSDIMNKIAVVNSITPIRRSGKKKQTEESSYYEQALLNRQFLNYPVVLTTHVSLFDTLFGSSRESVFAFHQLAGSVIVLDEIQSYKNILWGEIISFLTEMAEILHFKIIIMSATLPDLGRLTGKNNLSCRLLTDSDKYFSHPCFRERVTISRELLEEKITIERLYQHVKQNCKGNKKIMVEFIVKKSAAEFYLMLRNDECIQEKILYISGDDSILERKKLLKEVRETQNQTVILVATQVIEAGIDIDMDIGYKNIATLDSEEQFLGRINRSCSKDKKGMGYFFYMDNPKEIYGEDVRINPDYMISQDSMWEILEKKKFQVYYEEVLKVLWSNYAKNLDTGFFNKQVGRLEFTEVRKHMQLIQDDNWSMSVYLGRVLENEDGGVIDGNALWQSYKELLYNFEMKYAEKRVRLSEVTSKMNCFIYQIKHNPDLLFQEQIGELFYIEEGDKFFEQGKINRKKIQGEIGEFVDFI